MEKSKLTYNIRETICFPIKWKVEIKDHFNSNNPSNFFRSFNEADRFIQSLNGLRGDILRLGEIKD